MEVVASASAGRIMCLMVSIRVVQFPVRRLSSMNNPVTFFGGSSP